MAGDILPVAMFNFLHDLTFYMFFFYNYSLYFSHIFNNQQILLDFSDFSHG